MTESEKELKQLRQTCLQLAQENAQITSELENVQQSMGKLVEQTLASVELNKFQSQQIELIKAAANFADDNGISYGMADEFLKAINATAEIERLKAENDKLKGDDMADEMNAAEADRYEAHALGEIAQFVESVREMRAAQCEYFRTRDKAVMRKSMALEKQVDDAIKKDDYVLWALQYLPKQA